jgi:ribonuclease BN (tRNA processing enzyme)
LTVALDRNHAAAAPIFATLHDREDLTAWKAAEYAARARVGRLVLTHIPPWNDRTQTLAQALPAYDGPTDLASAGSVFDL